MTSGKFVTAGGLCLAALLWLIPRNPAASVQAAQGSGEAAAVRAAVARYCVGCHNSRLTTAATASGVVLDQADLNRVMDDPALWENVVRKLRTGSMPPEGVARPDL